MATLRYRGREIQPGASVTDDPAIDAFVRQHVESAYHPCGTCRMGDPADTMAVVYKGIAPDTITDSADVVVAGFATDGTFQAGTLLAKCASRYENAPDAEKYKQTPGYKAGAKA